MVSLSWSTESATELAQWHNNRHFASDLQAKLTDADKIRFNTQAVTDGSVYVARSRGHCSVNVNRSASDIRKLSQKVCTLYFPIHRRLRYAQNGVSDVAEREQFFILNGESPFTVTSTGYANDPWEGIFVTVPQTFMIDVQISPRDYGGVTYGSHCGFGNLAFSAFRDILQFGADLPPSEIRRLVRATLEMVSVAIRQHGPGRINTAVKDEQLARVAAAITANLGEQGLTAEAVARKCGISRRYLHMLFSNNGTSFSAHLWQERLTCAARSLADPGMAHHSIEQVAGYFGFRDASHFARLYKQMSGETPRETRASALGAIVPYGLCSTTRLKGKLKDQAIAQTVRQAHQQQPSFRR